METNMGAADREAIMPVGLPNRPGRKLRGGKPRYVTVHETSNYARGANAEMHRRFVWSGGGTSQVSFHYVVDDHESVHLVPDDEVAWHAGDGGNGVGNNESVAIETCVNADGDFDKTIQNLIKLVRNLMQMYNIPVENVVQHNHWSGKNCPMQLRKHGWAEFKAALAPAPVPDIQYFPETGQSVRDDFLMYYKAKGGLELFGYPITTEIVENGLTVQWFERARFERHQDGVKLGLLGVELLRLQGRM
jgi:N-acetylmuramoyl-L-alanine amidase